MIFSTIQQSILFRIEIDYIYVEIHGNRFLNDNCEDIFHLTKTGNVKLDRLAIVVPYKDASNLKRSKTAKNGIRSRGNGWYLPHRTIQSSDKERPHPAEFAVELPEYCIKFHGITSDRIVLDPLIGIGSTSLGCYKLGINYVVFETDNNYFEINFELNHRYAMSSIMN